MRNRNNFINHKKTLKWIIGISLLAIVLLILIPQIVVTFQDWKDRMTLMGNCFSIIGSIGTFSAVIVALFIEEIKNWLYKPVVCIDFSDENGFGESIDEDSDNPKANSYFCDMSFINHCSNEAKQCRLLVKDIKYGNSVDRLKSIKDRRKDNFVNEKDFEISLGIPRVQRLLEVNDINGTTTPNVNSNDSNYCLSLVGVELEKKYQRKGIWEVDYCFISSNCDRHDFRLSIEWDGVYKSRKTEMVDHLIITKK